MAPITFESFTIQNYTWIISRGYKLSTLVFAALTSDMKRKLFTFPRNNFTNTATGINNSAPKMKINSVDWRNNIPLLLYNK